MILGIIVVLLNTLAAILNYRHGNITLAVINGGMAFVILISIITSAIAVHEAGKYMRD